EILSRAVERRGELLGAIGGPASRPVRGLLRLSLRGLGRARRELRRVALGALDLPLDLATRPGVWCRRHCSCPSLPVSVESARCNRHASESSEGSYPARRRGGTSEPVADSDVQVVVDLAVDREVEFEHPVTDEQ